jgi:hypothetical protein
MNLIRNLFWFAVFLGATFAFTVLFEHGPANFGDNAKKEAELLTKLYNTKIEKKKDESDKIAH